MEEAGISRERMVVTPPLPNGEHMVAYRHADMFLDTPNYNGGITAVDVLWAGLPMVAMTGEHNKFPQRFCTPRHLPLGVRAAGAWL